MEEIQCAKSEVEGRSGNGRQGRSKADTSDLTRLHSRDKASQFDHSNYKIDELPCDFLTGSKFERGF